MGGQRQSSKGGGYVGGFLQLFDWNIKSRKKLFSNISDNPDQSKQKKKSDGNLPTTRFNPVETDVDEYVGGSSFKGSSEYSCASSVTDEDGFGSKAPSVVARLMGLDSMPTSNFSEPFSTPFFDSQSLQESHYGRQKLEFRPENHNIYSGNLQNKVDTPIQKAQKMMNRPIKKFQSEILPSKSAKTIPITHHKLLSPIKSPGFISFKNAAHIMEVAAKIIEPGPYQASTSKTKIPSVGSSTVPFKVRELREKVEASQKPRKVLESNAAKVLKGQPMNKSWHGSPHSEESLCAKNKGKSISLALQAKVNVQKREGRNEPSVMHSHPFKSQSKSIPRKPATQNSSGALKQNNQKQNCPVDKENLNSKSLKILSGDSSSRGTCKTSGKYGGNSKIGSRKLSPEASDSKEEVLYSSTRNVPRKRRSLEGNYSKDTNQIVDGMLVDSDEKSIQSDLVMDRQLTWAEESKRKGMDVVSFTFTTPLSRQNNVFGSNYRSNKAMLNSDYRNNGKISSVGCNVIGADESNVMGADECNVMGADDLSILLAQKLRDLTQGVESSRYREGFSSSSVPIYEDFAPTPQADASLINLHKKKNQDAVNMDMLRGKEGSNFTSMASKGLIAKYKLQGIMEMEECRSDDTETRKSLHFRHPSPVSVLDPSFMSESWNSSDTVDSMNIEGSKHCSSVQASEVLGMNSYRNPHFMEIDTECADSASSTKALLKGNNMAICMTTNTGSTWQLQYANEILFNAEFMFKDFALGRSSEIIDPHLFDQLENRNKVLKENQNDNKLERKVLFDCVSEGMNLRCSRYASGGFKVWAKGLATLKRKERLAEDVYKEISGCKGIEDSMVDDLVDKDMSSQYGKWLDFEVEAFELGIQIEGRILNSLINEMVANLVIR